MSGRAGSTRRLERELGVLARRLRRVVGERAREVHPDLQAGAYWMLAQLADDGPSRASALVETLDVDKGAVSRHVQHLLDLGLVARSPDPDDGRATLLSVTDDGSRRLSEAHERSSRWFEDVLAGWDDDELAAFSAEMARYNATIDRARSERDAAALARR